MNGLLQWIYVCAGWGVLYVLYAVIVMKAYEVVVVQGVSLDPESGLPRLAPINVWQSAMTLFVVLIIRDGPLRVPRLPLMYPSSTVPSSI
jgi:hypothetical protein